MTPKTKFKVLLADFLLLHKRAPYLVNKFLLSFGGFPLTDYRSIKCIEGRYKLSHSNQLKLNFNRRQRLRS